MSQILLCRPCAEQLKEEKKVSIGTSLRDKNTCERCGKRRFVYVCKKSQTLASAPKQEQNQ